MAPTLPLSNIINVNVFFPSTGLANFNVNNLALFTGDAFLSNPSNNTFRIYQSAQQVGLDFGTTSETYQQAVAVFQQQPNILAGGGSLIIFPSFQNNSISSVTVANGGVGYVIGDVLTAIQGNAYGGTVTVTAVYAGAVTAVTLTTGGQGFSIANNISVFGGSGIGAQIDITAVTTETLAQAVARCANMVYFCGIISTNYGSNSSWSNLASVVQSYGNKLQFLVSNAVTDIPNVFTNIMLATQYFTRCLFYSDSTSLNGRLFAASYASRLLSVNFNGSLTAITMNGKQLNGVLPDPNMTQTIFNLCQQAGVDIYTSFNNSPATVSNGANLFADRAFNLIWFVTALQVAGYNALQTSATKVPQTTSGMNSFVGALKLICQQAVTNGYLAAGQWTGIDTFGNQNDFFNNISTYGYYVYFTPVALQTAAQRSSRQSPLVQIAIKESGAIQGAIINVYDNP